MVDRRGGEVPLQQADDDRSDSLAEFLTKSAKLRRSNDPDALWILTEDLARQASGLRHSEINFRQAVEHAIWGEDEYPSKLTLLQNAIEDGFSKALGEQTAQLAEVKTATNEVSAQVSALFRWLKFGGGIIGTVISGVLIWWLTHGGVSGAG